MNKFNVTMIGLITIAVLFFGINIAIKANYKIQDGDSVSVTYDIITAEDTYTDQSTSVVIGENEDAIFTDEALTGVKFGAKERFDTTLTEAIEIDDETTLAKGDEVTIEAKVTNVVPAETTDETSSETSSEA